jgi:UDP-2,3-diacylglucosamine pyrophosphatase LpxH
MLEKEIIASNLDKLFKESPVKHLSKDDKIVILSDLHMGDGSKRDDFLHNADLFSFVLEKQYLAKNYTLILNGDIEELQRFSYEHIYRRWKSVYALFDAFAGTKTLYKIIGNHDYALILKTNNASPYTHLNSLVLRYKEHHLFIFHGHQASLYYTKHNALIEFALRYIANPLGIKNYSVAHDSRKQYMIEKRVYTYSSSRKIASIIGHTHRPLFESLSKRDYLEYEIEKLIRDFSKYPSSATLDKEKMLLAYRDELIKLNQGKRDSLLGYSLYNANILIPCLFNSGCVIGSRGITCIEIANEQIALVHYFDKHIKSVSAGEGKQVEQLANSDYYKVVINQEKLDYIFTRINSSPDNRGT